MKNTKQNKTNKKNQMEFKKIKPINIQNLQDITKENHIEIKREGFAPKGKYCNNCVYFNMEFQPKINPWNEEIERIINVAKCSFFNQPLYPIENEKKSCCMNVNKYLKCYSCYLQTDEKNMELANKINIPLEKALALFYISVLLANKNKNE